jgi:hypothetical protein
MSNSQHSTDNNDEARSRSTSGSTAGSRNELPPFQSFPAATQDFHPRPASGSQTALRDPAGPEVARGGSYRHETLDDVSIHRPRHRGATGYLMHRERQRTSTLPEFTPFPLASPSSRWAPPEGVRPEPPRPLPPLAFVPESTHYPPFHHGDAVRYPRSVLKPLHCHYIIDKVSLWGI